MTVLKIDGKVVVEQFALEAVIGYQFKSQDNQLHLALSHASIAPKGEDYERLEFLGDRVLGLVIAQWLLERFPNELEGQLTVRQTALVRKSALAAVAKKLMLGSFLVASAREIEKVKHNDTVLCDVCEAVLAAIYLDGGLDEVTQFIRKWWSPIMAEGPEPDHKSSLQEWLHLQKKYSAPEYEVLHETGPAHCRQFTVQVAVYKLSYTSDLYCATGVGGSKKAAEAEAARKLMVDLKKLRK